MKILLTAETTENTGNFDVVAPMSYVNDKGYEQPLISVQGVRAINGNKIRLWISLNMTVALRRLGEKLLQEDGHRHVYAHATLEVDLNNEIQGWLDQLTSAGYKVGTRIHLEKGSAARLGYIRSEAIGLLIDEDNKEKNNSFYYLIEDLHYFGELQFTSPKGRILSAKNHSSMQSLIEAFA